MDVSDKGHWSEDPAALEKLLPPSANPLDWGALWTALHREGMSWVSKCQGEWNVVHAIDTPIVYRQLTDSGA